MECGKIEDCLKGCIVMKMNMMMILMISKLDMKGNHFWGQLMGQGRAKCQFYECEELGVRCEV